MHYTVALFALANGSFMGTIGRFTDAGTARECACHHTAALGSCSLEQLQVGAGLLVTPQKSAIIAGYVLAPATPTHYLDDLAAVIVPPEFGRIAHTCRMEFGGVVGYRVAA